MSAGISSSSRQRTFWILAVVFTALVVAVYLMFVRTRWGQTVDDAALAGRVLQPADIISDAWELLDVISVATLGLASMILMGIAVVRNRILLALATGVMILGANMTTQVLKKIVLTRPDLDAGTQALQNNFPSGHATVAMSVAVALVLVVPSRFRWLAALLGTVYAVATGVAVVSGGWHRPSETVGAWFVVGAWTAFVLALLAAARRVPVMREIRTSIALVLAMYAVGAFGAGIVSLVGLAAADAWYREGTFDATRAGIAFATSTAGIVATALVTVGVLLFALRGTTIGYLPDEAVRLDPAPGAGSASP
ncbi:MAG: phosphatase PAP2 family protein [Actinomycetota bacterium]|nr:phosphatase PAP2 family protein [Actinomycetota bacterium]